MLAKHWVRLLFFNIRCRHIRFRLFFFTSSDIAVRYKISSCTQGPTVTLITTKSDMPSLICSLPNYMLWRGTFVDVDILFIDYKKTVEVWGNLKHGASFCFHGAHSTSQLNDMPEACVVSKLSDFSWEIWTNVAKVFSLCFGNNLCSLKRSCLAKERLQ